MSPFSIWTMAIKRHAQYTLFSKMVRAEVRDKQVYDMVAGDYGILWLIQIF